MVLLVRRTSNWNRTLFTLETPDGNEFNQYFTFTTETDRMAHWDRAPFPHSADGNLHFILSIQSNEKQITRKQYMINKMMTKMTKSDMQTTQLIQWCQKGHTHVTHGIFIGFGLSWHASGNIKSIGGNE